MIRFAISIALIVAATAVTGFAQQQGGGGGRTQDPTMQRGDRQGNQDKSQRNQGKKGNKKFREMDKNGDGYIQETEWNGNKKAFGKFDLNKDGQVSLDEFNEVKAQKGNTTGGGGGKSIPR